MGQIFRIFAVLTIAELNRYYAENHTLWNLDIEIPEGQCTCVMSRNGVGRMTLMACIMGLLPLRSGTMEYQGKDLTKLTAAKRAGLGIGYVPQGRQIFPLLTVEEDLQIGLPARADSKRQIPKLVFELFPVLKEMLGRRGGDVSGGQQQLPIGRALVVDPRLLIPSPSVCSSRPRTWISCFEV
jgi:urea transport system ATP-binding protein